MIGLPATGFWPKPGEIIIYKLNESHPSPLDNRLSVVLGFLPGRC